MAEILDSSLWTVRTVVSSFLLSGPAISIDLPDYFSSEPVVGSVVDFGNGGREVAYSPFGRHPVFGPPAYPDVEQVQSASGPMTVTTGKDPVQWMLQWTVRKGVVTTHVRDIEGWATVEKVAQLLHIVDGDIPAVLPDPPLVRVISQRGSAETITFFPTESRLGTIELSRPGALSAGTRREQMLGTAVAPINALSSGTDLGMDVTVAAPVSEADLTEIADKLVASLKVAT